MDDATIKRLDIREGETLAVIFDRPLCAEQVAAATAYVRERVPEGCKVLVLGGVTLAVLAKPALLGVDLGADDDMSAAAVVERGEDGRPMLVGFDWTMPTR